MTHSGGQQGVKVVDPGKPKVGQLEGTVSTKKHVLGLDVPMHNPVAVQREMKTDQFKCLC